MYRVLSFPQTEILGISHNHLEGKKWKDKKSASNRVLLATRDHCVALYNTEDCTCQNVWYFKGIGSKLHSLSKDTTFQSKVVVTKDDSSDDNANYSILYGDRHLLSWNSSYNSIDDIKVTSLPDEVFTILYHTSCANSLITVYTDSSVAIGQQRVHHSHIEKLHARRVLSAQLIGNANSSNTLAILYYITVLIVSTTSDVNSYCLLLYPVSRDGTINSSTSNSYDSSADDIAPEESFSMRNECSIDSSQKTNLGMIPNSNAKLIKLDPPNSVSIRGNERTRLLNSTVTQSGIICFLWSTGHITSLRLNDCVLMDDTDDLCQIHSYHKQYLIDSNLISRLDHSIMTSLDNNNIIIALQEQHEALPTETTSSNISDSETVQQHKLILLAYDPHYSILHSIAEHTTPEHSCCSQIHDILFLGHQLLFSCACTLFALPYTPPEHSISSLVGSSRIRTHPRNKSICVSISHQSPNYWSQNTLVEDYANDNNSTKKAKHNKKNSSNADNSVDTINTTINNHMLILNGMKLNQKQFNSWFTSLNISSTLTENTNLSYYDISNNNNTNISNNNDNNNSNNIFLLDDQYTTIPRTNELLLKSPQFDATLEQVLTRLLDQNKFWPHAEIMLLIQGNIFPQRLFSPLIDKLISFSHKFHLTTLNQLTNYAHLMDAECIAKLVAHLFYQTTTQPAGVSKDSLRSAKIRMNASEAEHNVSSTTNIYHDDVNRISDIAKLLYQLKSDNQQQKFFHQLGYDNTVYLLKILLLNLLQSSLSLQSRLDTRHTLLLLSSAIDVYYVKLTAHSLITTSSSNMDSGLKDIYNSNVMEVDIHTIIKLLYKYTKSQLTIYRKCYDMHRLLNFYKMSQTRANPPRKKQQTLYTIEKLFF